MATASANPTYRTAAHRRAVMEHIRATLLPAAFCFALLGPLVGMALIWGSTFVAMICQMVTGGEDAFIILGTFWQAIVSAYMSAAFPAAMAGVWLALLSPFALERSPYFAGAAAIGAVTTFLFVSLSQPIPGVFGGPLFLAVVGAVASFLCAWLLQDVTLHRDEAHRDRLSRDRADRLAKERAKA